MPTVASTSPAVLIAHLAASTQQAIVEVLGERLALQER